MHFQSSYIFATAGNNMEARLNLNYAVEIKPFK